MLLEREFRKKKASYWLFQLDLFGVPVGKLNNIKEALELKQILDRNMIVDVKFKNNAKIKVAGNPIKISNFKDKTFRRAAPSLDQDRKKILRDFRITEK